jgi:uncharacterized protein (TIGR00162 family)
VKNSLYYVKTNNNTTSINKKQIKNPSKLDIQLDHSAVNDSNKSTNDSLKLANGGSLFSSSNDLLLLTGDSQPVVPGSEYILSEQLLDLIAKFKISNIFSLASYVTGTFVNEPKIYGTATNPDIVKSFRSFDISTLDNGNITGMNGLILGLGKLRGIEGTCLLGETSGYVIDAKASKNLLEILNKILGIKINMDEMNKRSKDTEILIKNLEQQIMAKSGQYPQSIPTEEQDEGLIYPQNRKSNMGYIS